MKISVDKDRKVYTSSSLAGTVNENYYEVLEFTFPEELENYTKYIEIQAEDLRYVDRIENNKFTISNELTKYEYLQVQIVCKDLQNNIVYKSNIFTLSTNDSLNIMEDISVEQRDLLDRVELELQEAKEDIEELQETQTEHTEQIQANETDIETLQGQVATNETDIANIKTKNTQQDNAIATNTQDISNIKAEQTTQNTNIAGNTNRITVLEHDSGNKVALSINSDYVMTLQLLNKNNEVLSTGTIDLPIESMIVNASYSNGILTLTLQNGRTLDVDISDIVSGLVSETTFNNAISQLQGSINSLTTRMTQAETNIQENTDDIEALTTKHDTEVAELHSQIEDLQEENQALADQIPTGDASGSDITLSDSARYKFKKMVLGGKSEQETTDGRQLFDGNNPSGVNMVTSIFENDILTISSESTETIPFARFFENYEVSPNDTIRLNAIILDANGQIVVQEYINSQWTTISSLTRNYIDGKTISEISCKISENTTAIRVLFYSNNSKPTQSTSSRYKNIIVTKNNSNMEYERYTGGQPAPNPDYECPIKNVGDNVNIFDKSSTPIYKDQVATEEIENGVRVITQNTGTYHITLYLLGTAANLKGKEITVSANIVPSSSNLGGLGIILCDADGSNRTAIAQKNNITGKQSLTAKIDESYDDKKVVALRLYSNLDSAAKGDYVDYEELKVEEGTVATGYSAYNCGSVEVKVENKNKLKGFSTPKTDSDYWQIVYSGNNFTPLEDGWGKFEYNNANGSTTVFINAKVKLNAVNLKPNTQYTIVTEIRNANFSGSGAYFQVFTNNAEAVFATNRNYNSNGTFKVLATTKESFEGINISLDSYLRIGAGTSATAEVRLSVFEGDVDITNFTYIEHEEQTAIFPLEEGQVLHEGDTIEDKIVQKRKTVVFDGTENWALTNAEVGQFRLAINDMTKNPILSNYFGYKLSYSASGKPYLRPANGSLFAEIGTEFLPEVSVVAWKNWLAEKYANGTPVTLEYELETPIEIEFTEAQRTAKANIDKLYSYKGTTHITSEADLDVTYRKDLETMFDKMEELDARLSLLES